MKITDEVSSGLRSIISAKVPRPGRVVDQTQSRDCQLLKDTFVLVINKERFTGSEHAQEGVRCGRVGVNYFHYDSNTT